MIAIHTKGVRSVLSQPIVGTVGARERNVKDVMHVEIGLANDQGSGSQVYFKAVYRTGALGKC